jgi:Tol biopolymer transport system component
VRRYTSLAALALVLLALAGCQEQPRQMFIEVDNSRRTVTADAATVRDALAAANITLGPLDRVSPDLYKETEQGMVIVVTRVEEKLETTRVLVPFARKTVTNEALPAGATRLIQLGANGEDEVTTRVVFENGHETERTEVSRLPITKPVDEIIAVGAQDSQAPVPLDGTLAYLSAGNAWVMRDTSAGRRPLTTAGDLDSRVFDLSPDGRQLLYSRRLDGDVTTPINQLWLANTTIVGETPISLPIRGVVYAGWSPDGTRIAYSTAERTASSPGWKANNDLWLIRPGDPISRATQVISASTAGVYSWWGTTFEWSPDGRKLAYARADQIGVIDTRSPLTPTVLADFTAYRTYSEWVWVPTLSWSPDSRFVAAVVHGAPVAGENAQDSQAFDLWLYAADGSVQARIVAQVGMWSTPAWGRTGIIYGQAVNPLHSVDSRYELIVRDRDGSNPRRLFPVADEPGVEAPPQIAWAPDGQEFVFVYNGNLYLSDAQGTPPRQITSNNQNTLPRWAASRSGEAPPAVQDTRTVTSTATLTATTTVTNGNQVTPTNRVQ